MCCVLQPQAAVRWPSVCVSSSVCACQESAVLVSFLLAFNRISYFKLQFTHAEVS